MECRYGADCSSRLPGRFLSFDTPDTRNLPHMGESVMMGHAYTAQARI
jgi:hypothetical protein